jgi:hypothetical protein
MRRWSALALLLALIGASCGLGLALPSHTVPLGANDWGDYELLVYDQSGLVVGGGALRRDERAQLDLDGLVALPERKELEIGWIGGACSHRPTLHVSGSATSLRLVLRNPPDERFFPVACPAVGIPLAVVLSVAEPVTQQHVTLEVQH